MKILVVHNAYQTRYVGGEDWVVKKEIEGLKQHLGSHNVFEYSVSNDGLNPLKLMLTIWGNKEHYVNVKRMVTEHKIDIVHVHNFFPQITPSAFKAAIDAKAKVVHTLHNFRWWCLSGNLYRKNKGICDSCVNKSFSLPGVVHGCYRGSKLQSLAAAMAFYWYQLKEMSAHIDAYFALSSSQAQKLKTLLPEHKIKLKPNGIETPKETICIENKRDYLFVGRIEPEKGIASLLEAWKTLPSHFRLNVIGDGPLLPSLKEQHASESIRFLGQQPHDAVLQYIADAKFLIHPSKAYETFGLTMLEAMARGTPVIGYAIGTRVDFIEHEKTGFLCEENDLANTVIASHKMAHYKEMSENAIQFSKAFYLDKMLQKQIELYNDLLGVTA